MPDLTKSLEERVIDLETFYTDLPQLLNLRLDAQDAPLSLTDKHIALFTREMRDMRAGVTIQLRLQGERLDGMDQRLTAVETRLTTVEARLTAVETKLGTLETTVAAMGQALGGRMSQLEARFGGMERMLAEVLAAVKK